MPGGNNTSTRPVSKPGQPNPVKTVQTLLSAEVLTRSFVISFRSSFVVTSLKLILISSRSF
jgi:hypothetical protein